MEGVELGYKSKEINMVGKKREMREGGIREENNSKLQLGFMRNVAVHWLPIYRCVREALGSIQFTEAIILIKNFRVSSTVGPDDGYKSSLNYGHVFHGSDY